MGIDSIFGIGGMELLVILVIAGIVLGPKRIAQVANWLGRTTAYLQNISRGFAAQLRNELDSVDGDGDFKDMLTEVTALRDEVNKLQSQLKGSVDQAVKETKSNVDDSFKSIAPPKLDLSKAAALGTNGTSDSEAQEEEENAIAPPPPQLPNVVEVEDDPE